VTTQRKPLPPAPPPLYVSWADFLEKAPARDIKRWCTRKAEVANRKRLISGSPLERLRPPEVWDVMRAAEGRCSHCGSLALERRPSNPLTGAPLPWDPVGRRIGSLDHVVSRVDGGLNVFANLAWSCLWCNTWVGERRLGAMDHGAIQFGRA
jgi:hypothetical protein